MRFVSKHDNEFEKIKKLAREDGPLPRRPVDLGFLSPKTWFGRMKAELQQIGVRLLSRFFQIVGVRKFFGLYWVARHSDVLAILEDHDAFNSPFGLEMEHITKGVTFCLGDDGALHARQTDALRIGMENIDEQRDVREPTQKIATMLLADSGGEVDVSNDLIRQVVARVAASLLGCRVENHDSFSDALIGIGTLLFADPYGSREKRDEGLLAGRVMKPIIDECTSNAMQLSLSPPKGFDGIMAGMARGLRAFQARRNTPEEGEESGTPYTDEDMRKDLDAIGYGMTAGFAVTHTFFAGILGTFGKRPDKFKQAVEMARAIANARETGNAEDSQKTLDRFEQLICEASRFQPAIHPGSFRVRTTKALKNPAASRGLRRIPPHSTAMVCTAIAMHDPSCQTAQCKRPRVFDETRLAPEQLTSGLGFGHGIHKCLGARQALAIASETLICLLSQPNIQFRDKRPRVKYLGALPDSLLMDFDPAVGALHQSQIIAALPLNENCGLGKAMEAVRAVAKTGHLAACYEKSGIVHFASLNIVELGKCGKEKAHLLVELNVDGRPEIALARLKQTCEDHAGAIADIDALLALLPTDHGTADRIGQNGAQRFFGQVKARSAGLTEHPWGNTGLNFVGTGEFSVRQIEEENQLATALFRYLQKEAQQEAAADQKLIAAARAGQSRDALELLSHSEDWSTAFFRRARARVKEDKDLLISDSNRTFSDLLIRLRRRGPAFARADQVSFQQFLVRYATQTWVLMVVGTWVLLPLAALVVSLFTQGDGFWLFVALWMVPFLLLITLAAGLVVWLRLKENAESENEDRVDIEKLRRIRAAEERPDHAQTHITSVSNMKMGVFRRLTFALAMHVIGAFGRLWFRPGFLTDFATIHYARWVRFEGTDQLVFQSNYDGSWESYLEDFITKVHAGQTLAWNNAEGFPRTRWLWFDGAKAGDRFKRWVRNQQLETPFWYSRFPDLTIQQIQMNALIRDGLARADDVSDHRAWLKLFGSVPRNGTELEADQVQSIVFNPHGKHELAVCAPLQFGNPEMASRWIRGLLRNAHNTGSAGDAYSGSEGSEGTSVTTSGGEHGAIPLPLPVLSFGDGEPAEAAMFLGFSAGGLAKLGVSEEAQTGLNSFPSAFLDGMSGRAAALDDPDAVDWGDKGWKRGPQAREQEVGFEADAVALIYLRRPAEMENAGDFSSPLYSKAFSALRKKVYKTMYLHDIKIRCPVDMTRRPGELPSMGGFGFHEGASQPKIRGSRNAAKPGVHPGDILPAGEFLLGYEDLRGHVPPHVFLREDVAARDCLPFATKARPEPYPYFGDPSRGHIFDLGRNGSFLVIRQLEHLEPAQPDVDLRSGKELNNFDVFIRNEAWKLAERINAGVIKDISHLPLDALVMSQGGPDADSTGYATTTLSSSAPRSRSQGVVVYSSQLGFLTDLVRAKLIGRWPDGSSLVRHPLLSATALLRQRTLREIRVTIDNALFEEILRQAVDLGPTARNRPLPVDQLLWDDERWDLFVSALRKVAGMETPDLNDQFPELDVGLTPQDRDAILYHPWIKPHDKWPSRMDNDFNFGLDDPQGLACPIGSHIRRSNPRDTPNPDNPNQFDLNNRHRIIRRGRTYVGQYKPKPGANQVGAGAASATVARPEQNKGTHFMCLNADIERQYEFIQRTWLNARDFQGLVGQPDPVAAPHRKGDRFVIPHTSNLSVMEFDAPKAGKGAEGKPVSCSLNNFVNLKGGGYFFLPSRAALAYLAHPDRQRPEETH